MANILDTFLQIFLANTQRIELNAVWCMHQTCKMYVWSDDFELCIRCYSQMSTFIQTLSGKRY